MMYFMFFMCGLIIGLSLYYLYLVVKDKKVNMIGGVFKKYNNGYNLSIVNLGEYCNDQQWRCS